MLSTDTHTETTTIEGTVETEQNLPQDINNGDRDVAHRHFLTDIGESLMVPEEPDVMGARIAGFSRFTGLSKIDTLYSPLVAHPLPFYPASWPVGRKRWAGVKSEAMWHPLFWLPDRLSERYRLSFRGGEVIRPENDDEWAVRVMLESEVTDVYDERSGSWVDVLALNGLDVSDPDVQERVQMWAGGGNDDILDQFDISPMFDDPEEPDWALDVVPSVMGDLYVIAYATISDGLLDATSSIMEGASGSDPSDAARSVAMYAATSLSKVRRDESTWWMHLVERINDASELSTSDLLSGPVSEMRERLTDIVDHYAPMAEVLAPVAE